MATRIGVVSDTHLVSPAGLPSRLAEVLAGVDRILHAGDVVALPVITALEQIAPVVAVSGNMDQPAVKAKLPLKVVLEFEGKRVGLIHGHGVPGVILDRRDEQALHDYLRRQFEDPPDCIVYGHTHRAVNKWQDGILFFNPGTATGRGANPTVGILTIDNDRIAGEIIDIS